MQFLAFSEGFQNKRQKLNLSIRPRSWWGNELYEEHWNMLWNGSLYLTKEARFRTQCPKSVISLFGFLIYFIISVCYFVNISINWSRKNASLDFNLSNVIVSKWYSVIWFRFVHQWNSESIIKDLNKANILFLSKCVCVCYVSVWECVICSKISFFVSLSNVIHHLHLHKLFKFWIESSYAVSHMGYLYLIS